jgi:SAM-dependent methyltransferase
VVAPSEVLRRLYREQLEQRPADDYLRQHGQPAFLESTTRVFRFYESYLPSTGRVLDWGCRHAPDACLIRVRHPELEVDGCDVFEADEYPVFFQFARLRYQRLRDTVRLPYADATFDAVVASGVLEHVPMDYESLKEIYRVLRPEGSLVVTYLPNRASVEEWSRRRRSREPHVRLYSLSGLRGLLLHTGFRPLVIGYQTRLDALRENSPLAWLRFSGIHHLTACLCAIASRTAYL